MRECETMIVKRGDIYYADLRPVIGSEQEIGRASCRERV